MAASNVIMPPYVLCVGALFGAFFVSAAKVAATAVTLPVFLHTYGTLQ